MIQFSGPEALAMPEQSGFTRLARQPEDQGGLFPPLDLLMEEGALAPATEEVKEEVEQDEPDEVADNVAARLDAFSICLPHSFCMKPARELQSSLPTWLLPLLAM